MKAPPIKKIVSCKCCLDKTGRPKPIWPEEMKHARKWKTVHICVGFVLVKDCLN